MSASETADNGSILPGSVLARVLDDYPVPELDPGFAERVVASAQTRPAALPPLPRTRSRRGWRLRRRVAVGLVSFGALATTAAATGLLERLDLPVPSAARVWGNITGAPSGAARPVVSRPMPPATDTASPEQVAIEGPIDTPEELSEAFRRIDEVRSGRRAERRGLAEQRITSEIERRRAAGLPVPTPEEEAALRERIAAGQARRDAIAADRIARRRGELAGRLESGEALTREDIMRPLREDASALARARQLRQLRRMPPEERRAALRQMPPEERRALIEALRQWRTGVGAGAGAGENAEPDAVAEPPSAPSPAG